MKFAYTIIYVDQVEQTLNFYKKAFNLETRFLHESKHYGELNTGNTKLAFASTELAQSNGLEFINNNPHHAAAGFEIGLESHDVEQDYHHAINNGAISIQEPALKPWGQTVAYVRDLNGIIIEIGSPMSE
ncbi:MAG: VOC family protein [Legionellales bacterium]|nr:VOC family protein [Legionellales bacterium]